MLKKLKTYTQKGKGDDKEKINDVEYDYTFKKYFVTWRERLETFLKQNIVSSNKDDSESLINKVKDREASCELFNEFPYEEIISLVHYLKDIDKGNDDLQSIISEEERKDKKEKPSEVIRLIDELCTQIKFYQKKLYDPSHRKNIITITNQITVDLSIIYLLMKRFPLSISPKDKIESYLTQFLPYKNWPNPTGNIGFLIYTHLLNELYLPGLSLLNEIRELYFFSLIDPNKFIFKQDDFLNYFSFGFEASNSKQASTFDNEYKGLINESKIKQKASDVNPNHHNHNHQQATKASLEDFDSLTIIHMLIFSTMMFYSYQNRIEPELIRSINNYFNKAIPEYKFNNAIELQLITKNAKDKTLKETLIPIINKNLTRNVNNKNLFNSFCNVIDEGINLSYYDKFVPLINKIIHKMNIESTNDNEGSYQPVCLNKYLRPKIYQLETKQEGLNVINCYQKLYSQLQKKYLEHLSIINIKEFKLSNDQLKTVEKYNLLSETKLEMVRTKIQLRYIVPENYLNLFLMIVFRNLNEYYSQIKKIDYDNDNNNNTTTPPSKDNIQIPSLSYFLESITVYLFPQNPNCNSQGNTSKESNGNDKNRLRPKGNCLFNYIKQRDIIYHIVNLNQEVKNANQEDVGISKTKSKLVNAYLTEAKYSFDLTVYRIKSSNNEKFFYGKVVLESLNMIEIELYYDDDCIPKVVIGKGNENVTTDKQYVKIIRLDKDNIYGNNNDTVTNMLDVFVYEEKWEIYDKGNMTKEKDRMFFQSICDSYKANRIRIINKRIGSISIDIDDMGKIPFEGIIDITPVYFDTEDKQKFQIKVATFVDINEI